MRSTMQDLVDELRGMTNTGYNDYQVGNLTYWANDHLLAVMDARRVDYKFFELSPVPDYTGGTVSIHDYQIPFRWYEQGGTTLQVMNNLGNAYGTALYTLDDARNMVVFTNHTYGSLVALQIHTFDLNEIAAEIWRRKAAHYAMMYDFSTDNHNLRRSQLIDMAEKMASRFESLSMTNVIYADRDDMPGETVTHTVPHPRGP